MTKKAAVAKKRSPKKKTPAKVKADDDSDLEVDSSGEVKSVERKGGFHVRPAFTFPILRAGGHMITNDTTETIRPLRTARSPGRRNEAIPPASRQACLGPYQSVGIAGSGR